ncbi:MAG: T9SS type A sorting domain-containing protein, partial [Cytophagales bacterium]|nr:T9SS type A sorting domain-containing protein [Cytophagales bacterium]
SGVPTGVVITGPTTVCPDYSYNYAVSPVNQTIGYHWKVIKTNDTDPTPTTYGKNYNNGMNVKYPYAPGLNYTISIAATNKCGSIDVILPVSVRSNTAPKPYITCTNKVGTTCTQLSTPTNANVTSIVWNIDGVNVAALNNSATVDLNNPAYRGVNYKVTLSDGNCSYWAHFGECKNVVQGQTREAAEEIELPVAKPYLIYPNPSSGTVTIETKGQEGKAYLFNTFGQVVAEVELSKGETVYSVALAAKGLYTIKIKADGESNAYKLIVE